MAQHFVLNHASSGGVLTASAPLLIAQDGFRAWLVLFGSLLAGALTVGNAYTLSVMFHPVHQLFPDAKVSSINTVFALCIALTYMTGSLAPAITSTAVIGYRGSILIGATIACAGFIGASFATTNIWLLYATLGVTTGVGFGLIFTPAIGIISAYFDQYRRFAATTATTGVGIGVIALARIHSWLLTSLEWQWAMRVEAAMASLLFICGLIVQNPPSQAPTTCRVSATSVSAATTEEAGDVEEKNVLTAGASCEQKSKDSPPKWRRMWKPEMFGILKFYFILGQGLTLLASSVFLVSTPPYLIRRHGWSVRSAAIEISLFGVAVTACRLVVSLLNAFSKFARRVHVAFPLVVANLMMISTACVFVSLMPIANSNTGENNWTATSGNGKNSTTNATTLQYGTLGGNEVEVGLLDENHAVILTAFACIHGVGHGIFLAYQPALVIDMLGAENLTAGFGYLNFVWGLAALGLYPLAGAVADAFGSMRYSYVIDMACCTTGLCALAVATYLHRRDVRKERHGLRRSRRLEPDENQQLDNDGKPVFD